MNIAYQVTILQLTLIFLLILFMDLEVLHAIVNANMQNLHIMFLEKCNPNNEARISLYKPFLRFFGTKACFKSQNGLTGDFCRKGVTSGYFWAAIWQLL